MKTNKSYTPSEGFNSETNNNTNPNNGGHKMTRQQRRMMEREGYKLISLSELKQISDTNYGKLNRSVDTDVLEKYHPELKSQKMVIEKLIEHYHSYGKPVDVHYRCGIKVPNVPQTLFQDLTIEQWESIGKNETISIN
jgi:hypothetical protein